MTVVILKQNNKLTNSLANGIKTTQKPREPIPLHDMPHISKIRLNRQKRSKLANRDFFKEHDGMMVAWFLPMVLARAIHGEHTVGAFPPDSKIEKPEDYHITIAYMQSSDDVDAVKGIIEKITKKYRPFRLAITGGVERFEEVEDGTVDAVYASIQSETLNKFREEIVDALGDRVETHGDGYTPHMTLAYVPTGVKDKARVSQINVMVGEVHLAVADEVYRYPLSGHYKQIIIKGGPGSGHRGHRGRPGKRGGSLPGTDGGIATDYQPPKKIRDGKGNKVTPPREFYRGVNPGDTRRIRTGATDWDSYLFVADNQKSASAYGSSLTKVTAKPGAKILYEGTQVYKSVRKASGFKTTPGYRGGFNEWRSVAEKAQQEGFDAVWYLSQTDVGTAIFNPDMFSFTENKQIIIKGGPGSGHRGHAGRPGKVGGSVPGTGSSLPYDLLANMEKEELTVIEQKYEQWHVSKTNSAVLPDGTKVHMKHSTHGKPEKEAAAYEVSQMLGEDYQDLVPPTVLREPGVSAQLWIDDAPIAASYDLDELAGVGSSNLEDVKRIALMDAVFNNQDRHQGNILLRRNGGGAIAIDNDHMFRTATKDIMSRIADAESQVEYYTDQSIKYKASDFQPFVELLNNPNFEPTLGKYIDSWHVSKIVEDLTILQGRK